MFIFPPNGSDGTLEFLPGIRRAGGSLALPMPGRCPTRRPGKEVISTDPEWDALEKRYA
jgi:hypothetical protein